jgi:hypothetical protein
LLKTDQQRLAIFKSAQLLRLIRVRSAPLRVFKLIDKLSQDVIELVADAFDDLSVFTISCHHFSHMSIFAALNGPPGALANWQGELAIGQHKKLFDNGQDLVETWALAVRSTIFHSVSVFFFNLCCCWIGGAVFILIFIASYALQH